MTENRADSAVEADMWTEDEHNSTEDDDDVIADDVFELLCISHAPGEDERGSRPARPASVKRRVRVQSQQEGSAPGSTVQPHPVYSQWKLGGRQHVRQGNSPSIITYLHPTTFSLETARAAPPRHPPPTPPTTPTLAPSSPTPMTEDPVGLVTLHSLCCGRDSGYVPSPSSTQSFTFSSDEDEPKATPTPRPGVTPPIAIPHARHRPTHRPPTPEKNHQEKTTPKSPVEEKWTPTQRCRTRSCPEEVRPPTLPRTPVPRFPSTLTPTPAHGRNWSTPATTPDGLPILTPPPLEARAITPRASRDALIDLTEEDGGASGGHRRRVLVLALPDVVIDTEGRASGACTPPSAQSPGRHPESRDSFEVDRCRLGGARPRPAWRKPRALSCDVTMEEEVGQELRRIADRFHLDHAIERANEEDVSSWRCVLNSFRRSLTSFLSSSQSTD
ncbi:uncharacterized protein [Panulirus ornatus]|uniref:uncharacterized protein isoform X2 n=1 Tax=Panulirus ornatus TaxID=150431 RepID=UPI003A857DB3